VDHRLVRDGHLLRLQQREILLYFFLVLVGDQRGLSFYSAPAIKSYLKLPFEEIDRARTSLCHRSLIAYKDPLYQVLSLPEKAESPPRPSFSGPRGGEALSIGEILQKVLKRNPHD